MRFRILICAVLAALAFPSMAAIPASEQVKAIEFYHAELDHYFISSDPTEISDLDSGVHPGWTRTGYQFPVITAGSAQAGTLPVCRFYGKKISSHFYSASASECEEVKANFADDWSFESAEVFRTFPIDLAGNCPADTTPVYRLWNQRADANHRYTDQRSAFAFMVANGYKPEGAGDPTFPVLFCAPAAGSVAPAPKSSAPNCTLTASSGAPVVGSTLNLEAVCTGSPTAFMWAGCTSSTSKCSTTQSTAGVKSYTVYPSNTEGPGGPVSISVNWGGGSGAVPICTLSASSSTPTNGSPLTLTASCSQTPNQYDWMECNYLIQAVCTIMPSCPASASTCTFTSQQPGYARYAIAGLNTGGTGPRAAVDVEWKQSSGGGGGGGGGGGPVPSCSIIASNSVPLVNTPIVLTASCSENPTSYSWSGISCSGIQCSAISATPGVVTYSLTAGNASGSSSVAYKSVDWQSSVPSGTPSCTLLASNTAPLLGETITIASTCTSTPTNYTWTGCTSNNASCDDSASAAGVKQYKLTAANGSGSGPEASISVNWQVPPPPPSSPPVCTVSASSTTPTVGENVVLSVTCNGAPTSFDWSGCTGSTGATCTTTSNTTGIQTYYVAGVNGFGKGGYVGINVNWQAPGGGGGGGGGANFCGAYSNVVQTSIAWGDSKRYLTSGIGGFAANGVVVMSFTVPSAPASYQYAGYTSMAEFQGPPALRHMTLSKSACDFRAPDPTGASGPYAESYGVQATLDWNVGGQPVALEAGQTYYFNFRNWSATGGSSCGGATCNAGFSTNWPR